MLVIPHVRGWLLLLLLFMRARLRQRSVRVPLLMLRMKRGRGGVVHVLFHHDGRLMGRGWCWSKSSRGLL